MTTGAPERVDVLVVGGGIHGAGVLQAVAAAGHSAALVEEREPAWGTSSRSSKLIHGGLRYLETAQLGLVRESLSERKILLEVAPHLVRLVPFFIPVYRDTVRRPWQIRAGLSMYAALGGLSEDARFAKLPKRRWGELDGLRTEGLQAVFRYHDGQTDDRALTRAVIASAGELGATLLCPAALLGARRAGGLWRARVRLGDEEHAIEARAIVNAGGPWADAIDDTLEPRPPSPAVDLVAGTHIELAGRLEQGIYYAEAPRDRRAVFFIPWKGHVMVGTTETPYDGPPEDVAPLPSEVDYLVETLLHYMPDRKVEVLDSWAGLRVLPRGDGTAFDRPRDVTLVTDGEPPHLVAIYGGKLTGYRATAEKVLDLLERTLPERERRADTRTLRLPELEGPGAAPREP